MNYQKFQNLIKEQIKNYLPEEYQEARIDITTVTKNNNQKLDGLNIRFPDENICPTIYLNSLYEEYQNGRDIEEIMEHIAKLREEHGVKRNLSVEKFLDFENIRDKIIFQVVGSASNQEQLSNMPHHIENDMAFVYRVLIQKSEEGMASTQISNAMMKQMGVNEDMLYRAAMENTPREFPVTFCSMNEVMLNMMRRDFGELFPDDMPDNEVKDFLEEMFGDPTGQGMDLPMYVLSNDRTLNGAAALFYPGVQEMVAEEMKGDYFVLPSSIHEVLIVPDGGEMKFEELRAMVNQVNDTEVEPGDVLTGEVYSYDRENKKLMIAEERFSERDKRESIMDKLKTKGDEVKNTGSNRKPAIPEPAL